MPELDRWENEGGSTMRRSNTARLKALQNQHSRLETKLEAEQKRPSPCSIEVQRLKREKLYLRDEIRRTQT